MVPLHSAQFQLASERQQRFSSGGNSQNMPGGERQFKRPRFRSVDACRETLYRPSLPGGAVDNGLAVGSEPTTSDGARSEM